MKNASSGQLGMRIGFLGGGQLARMLALKAHEMGLVPHVLCQDATEPAAQVTSHWVQGNPHSLMDILAFAKTVDAMTLESEFIPGTVLNELAKKNDLTFFPRPQHVAIWQDRAQQKKALLEAGLPTSKFIIIKTAVDAELFFAENPKGIVLKKRHGGYDGYGTFIARNKKELARCLSELDFSNETFLAEAFVPFQRELAFVVARNQQKDFVSLPFVQTHQEDRRLDWLIGPVEHNQTKSLIAKIKRMLAKMDYVGTMAFELFETKGQLLVNEIAPRVHNSAHYTLEALAVDQFTLHLMAVTNAKLEPARMIAPHFAMVNLIGTGTAHSKISHGDAHLHWYGKMVSRPGRKMGHLTWAGSSQSRVGLALLKKQRKGFQI